MIQLQRDRNTAAINRNYTGDGKRRLELELLKDERRILRREISRKNRFKKKSNRWKAAKEQLVRESKGKCAYCEAPTAANQYGDVEHYRPKSVYWWLAYSYENFLVCCQLCNEKYKRAKFPVINEHLQCPQVNKESTDQDLDALAGALCPDPLDTDAIEAFAQRHTNERPLILNPYYDIPEEYFGWMADEFTEEVKLVSNPANPDAPAYVEVAEKELGLNRPGLSSDRYITYSLFMSFKRIMRKPSADRSIRTEVEQAIMDMKANKSPYAGMIRYFDIIL